MNVFTLEAIATCVARGHTFADVRAWHAVGWRECVRCGETAGMVTVAEAAAGTRSAVPAPPNEKHAERDLRIAQLRAQGMTTGEIGRMVGVSQSRVSQIMGRMR